MFAEIWKIANKTAASNYIGPTLESVHDMESSDFVTFVNRHDVLESAKTIVIHLLKSDAHERVHVNTQRQTINIKVLMGAYLVVVFPVHGDNESSCGRSYNDRVQYLAEPAKALVETFEKALSDCAVERRPDIAAFRTALFDFKEAFAMWKPETEASLVSRIEEALKMLYDAGIPDSNELAQRMRAKLVQYGGREALDRFDAVRNTSSLDALVPRGDSA